MAFPCGAPCEAGTAGPAPHRVVPGSQPTQCNTLGLARGSGPFEPPTRGERSPAPPITPAAPFSLSHAGVAFDGVLTPLNPRALPGRLDFLTPWHSRAPRNASWTDFPLRDRRSRRLWGNRNGRLAQRSRGRHPVRANRPDRNCSIKPRSPSAVRGRHSEQNRRIACGCRHLQPRPGPSHHGLTERLRPPPTSRKVQWIPVQLEGYNEGIEAD